MAAVSQATNTLLGGVSQQPDPNKLAGQVREAVNVQLNPTFGCEKRPPTKFVSVLANDISLSPEASYNQTIKWFNIFRDSREKYIVCIYRDDTSETSSTRVRVWDCGTGEERCVYIYAASQLYLNSLSPTSYRHLTIGDYTLITNPDKEVVMNSSTSPESPEEALAVVNQIAYNTTYNINFLKANGSTTPVKVYSASTLSVGPSTFEETGDDGACTKATSQSFIVDQGGKTGLSFDLTAICQPTQVANSKANNSYPTSADYVSGPEEGLAKDRLGEPSQYGNGSYVYVSEPATNVVGKICNLRIEYRVTGVTIDGDGDVDEGSGNYVYSGVSITGYDEDYNWSVNEEITVESVKFKIVTIKTPPDTITYDYKSVYRTSVRMRSGGIGWREGDTVSVTMAGKSYQIKVETETFGYGFESESSVSYTTQANTESGGNLDVGDIVGALTTQINALSNYSAEPIGNVIYIKRTDGNPFNIQANGGTNERAIYAIKGSVNDVSLLPIQCKDGVTLLVRNTVDSTADDYYVRFTTAQVSIPGQGAWEETVKPGIPTTLDPSSLPQALVRQADGNFILKPLSPSLDCSENKTGSWVARDVGDLDSNPDPTFVGRGITNMFFFQNRLGFLSQDAVIMSQPGSYFNFFVGSAIAVSDADPIDMIAASEEPSFLKEVVQVPQGAILFAENSQYLLSTTEVAFGPSTAKITQISDYSYDSKIKPLETGVSIMFHTEAATFSKIFEMAIPNTDQSRPQVAEITKIIPEYIPPSLNWSATNPNSNQVFFGYGDNTAYNFSFFNVSNERSMSGWTKWVFNYDVAHMGYFQDRGYVILFNPATKAFILSTIDPLDNPSDCTISAGGREFTPRLDALIPKSSCTLRDISDTETEVTIPSFLAVRNQDDSLKEITAIFGDLGNATYFQEYPLVVGAPSDNPPPTPGPCVPDEDSCGAPPDNPCEGVTCPDGERCVDGICTEINPSPDLPFDGGDWSGEWYNLCEAGCLDYEGVNVVYKANIEDDVCVYDIEWFVLGDASSFNFKTEWDSDLGLYNLTAQVTYCGDTGVSETLTTTSSCPSIRIGKAEYNFIDCPGVVAYNKPASIGGAWFGEYWDNYGAACYGYPGSGSTNKVYYSTPDYENGGYKYDRIVTNLSYEQGFFCTSEYYGNIDFYISCITWTDPDGETREKCYTTKGPGFNIRTDPSITPDVYCPGITRLTKGAPSTLSTSNYAVTTSTVNTPNSFIISKENAALDFSVGYSYPMKVELPSFYLMGNKEAERNDVPVVENVKVYLYLSGSYQAKLSRLGYEDKLVDLEVAIADIYKADSNPIAEVGEVDIPLFCRGDLAVVEISSESPLPAALTGYGWEGHFSNRGVKTIKR